ncbi:MORN repeat variant [Chryseobacterium contaminans]|nr:MORN repeat variant [Chryseobacterium contaminans]
MVFSCKSQNIKDILPTIDSKFEVFDTILYKKLYNKNPSYPSETLDNGSYLEMNVANYGKSYSMTLQNSYYTLTKVYFPNGNIKTKGISNNTESLQIGIWYEFDENGKLIKEIDYDKPYKFTFEDILKFCEKEGIPLTKGPVLQSTGFHTTITRRIEKEKPIWEIEWKKKFNIVESIILDGTSGKIISRRESEFINN